LADRGQLFCDEVGEIPLELSRNGYAFCEQESKRLGRNRTQRGVRVVAATNGDLSKLVAEKAVRSDYIIG